MSKKKKEEEGKLPEDDALAQAAHEIIEEAESLKSLDDNKQEPVESVNSNGSDSDDELAKAQNEYLYLKADFDNYKKRVIKERANQLKYGTEHVFVQLLEVLDNFERALEGDLNENNIENFKVGVKLIHKELIDVLGKFGVQEIQSKGKAFDPQFHEAIGSEPSQEVKEGHILHVVKNPYKLHDKVIRPGQVIVASKPPTENNKEE